MTDKIQYVYSDIQLTSVPITIASEYRITQGLEKPQLKHPHHKTFHKSVVSQEDEDKGITRFYRWHIDSALYDLETPIATTLYALSVPSGPHQTVRYDDGTGDELEVPLGTTACRLLELGYFSH